jgi:tetratricopeptide (TPR) repeat protein
VNSLVEGSIRQVGTRIRLTAQLVDEDGYQRWSQTYERTMSDVFALQEELAQAIARELPIVVSATEDLRLVQPASQNVEAYTLYMRGRYFANKRTIEGLGVATRYYEQAIALDPSAAPAHCGLAACMSLRGFEEFGDLAPRESMPKARAAALRALEIDPASTEAHLWRAVVLMLYDWDRSAAEAEFQLATEAGQNPIAHLWHAVFLGIGGRFEESMAVVQRAMALDPLSLPVHQTVARCYTWAEEYDKALEQLQVTRQMDPHHPLTYVWLARAYLGAERLEQALAEAQTGMEAVGRAPLLLQLAGCAYGRLGREAEARGVLSELRELSQHRYVSPMFEGYILGAMGELDAAFQTFDGALEQRCGLLAFLDVSPETRGCGRKHAAALAAGPALRSDPRFAALLKRVQAGA